MNEKIFKIILEEVEGYDFLNVDKNKKEEYQIEVLNSKEFQTTFIHDVINNLNDTNKFKAVNATYQHMNIDQSGMINEDPLYFEFEVDITYMYNETTVNLQLMFEGDNVNYNIDHKKDYGNYNNPPEENFELQNIDWDNIKFSAFTSDGTEINMSWVPKSKLYAGFVTKLIKPLILSNL